MNNDTKLPKRKRVAFNTLKPDDIPPCEACAATTVPKKHPNDKNDTQSHLRWTGDVSTSWPKSRQGNTNMFIWVAPCAFIEGGFGKHKDQVFDFTVDNYETWNKEKPLGFKDARTDRGGEYVAIEFENWFKENGISFSRTAPYASCGPAETAIKTIKKMSKAMRYDAKAPHQFWDEAANYAMQVKNMMPSFSKQYKDKGLIISPFEVRYNKPPPLHKLHRWGSLCFVPDPNATSCGDQGRRCAFMGLAAKAQDGFRLWTGKSIIHAKTATWVEDKSYWELRKPDPNSPSSLEACDSPLCKGKQPGQHSVYCEFHPDFWGEEEEDPQENEEHEESIEEEEDADEPVRGSRPRKQTQHFDPQAWDAAFDHDKQEVDVSEQANIIREIKERRWEGVTEHADVILNTVQHIEHSYLVVNLLESVLEDLDKLHASQKAQFMAYSVIEEVNAARDDLDKISERYNARGQLKHGLIPNGERELQDSEDRKMWVAAKLKEMRMLNKLKTLAKHLRTSVPPGCKTIRMRWEGLGRCTI